MDDVGKIIRTSREKRGWSLYRLGKESGLPDQTVSNIESGKHDPQISKVTRVLAALGLRLRVEKMKPVKPTKASAPDRE